MKHLQNALKKVADNLLKSAPLPTISDGRQIEKTGTFTKDKKVGDFISVEGNKLTIKVQDGVISENGINGVQITDVLEFVKEVYESLNSEFRCRENALTITKIEEGLHWQKARTENRIKRNVEGKNLA